MFGQNVGKAMTKEDHIQLMNASKFLVSLSNVRKIQELAPPIKIEAPVDSTVDTSILEIRLMERHQEEQMTTTLVNHTLQDAVKARRKLKSLRVGTRSDSLTKM